MWRRYFRFKLVPGIVITRQFGRIDFRSNNLKISDLQRLYEEDFPYLEITPEGKRELYGIEFEPAPSIEPKKAHVNETTKETVVKTRKKKT